MTTIEAQDAGSDLKGFESLQRRNTIATLNKIGLFGVVIFAPASFIAMCVWFSRCDVIDLMWGGNLGLHIFLMSTAFLLFGPMASISYRLLHGYFGANYKTAKNVHGGLQCLSCLLGIIAVREVYVAHEDSALAYLESGSYDTYHFKSSHSIVGIFALSIYMAQLVTGLYVYYCGDKEMKKSYHQLHMAVGQGLVLGMLYVAAMGLMFFEAESNSLGWDDYGSDGYYRPYMTVAQYCIVFLMFAVILVFYAKILL